VPKRVHAQAAAALVGCDACSPPPRWGSPRANSGFGRQRLSRSRFCRPIARGVRGCARRKSSEIVAYMPSRFDSNSLFKNAQSGNAALAENGSVVLPAAASARCSSRRRPYSVGRRTAACAGERILLDYRRHCDIVHPHPTLPHRGGGFTASRPGFAQRHILFRQQRQQNFVWLRSEVP
jgi:hypothetical protein